VHLCEAQQLVDEICRIQRYLASNMQKRDHSIDPGIDWS
jgi:hypothetical protein